MAGGSTTYRDEVTHFTFASDTKSDYVDDYIVFYEIQTADAGTAKAVVVWFDTTGSATVPSHGISPVEVVEVDISDAGLTTRDEYVAAAVTAINAASGVEVAATRSNNVLIITNDHGGPTTDAVSSNANHITHSIIARCYRSGHFCGKETQC